MRILSQQACKEWLRVCLGKDSALENLREDYVFRVEYQLPIDTGKKTAIARVLAQWLGDVQKPGLFLITGWGIFQSGENMSLFDGYRKSLGESRPLHAAPGHVFADSDLREMECLLDLALYFFWDASLLDEAGTFVVRISHDEFIAINTKNEDVLRQFQSRCAGPGGLGSPSVGCGART